MASPYSLTRASRPMSRPSSRFGLTRQAPLTEGAQLEEEQTNEGLRTGRFADVESAANATARANMLRTSQSLQAARGTVARSGEFSPEAALRAEDQALASSAAQNLNADNQVRQLGRQYRQDALNRAGQIEERALGVAGAERAYQTDREDADRSQGNTDRDFGESTRRFDLSREDSRGDRAEDTRRFDLTFGASREDAADDRQFRDTAYAAGRDDALYARNYTERRDQVGDSRYDQQYGDSRSDRADDVAFRDRSYGDSRDDVMYGRGEDSRRFDLTFGANREDASENRRRFDITREDSRSDRSEDVAFRDRSYGDSREDVADARSFRDRSYGDSRTDRASDVEFRDRSYGDSRQDVAYEQGESRRRFDVTREDSLTGRAEDTRRFDLTFGANREDRAEDTAFRDRSYSDTRGDVAYNQGEERRRFDVTREDSRADRASDVEFRDRSYGDSRVDRSEDVAFRNRSYSDTREDIDYEKDYRANRDALGDIRYRDETQYARGRDAVGDARYEDQTAYSRGRDAVGDSRYADETAYSRGRDQVGDQRYADETQYGRNRDALADARYDQQYTDQRGDIAYNRTEAQRLEGKGDSLAAINSIEDPKARQAAYNAYMRGEDVSRFITSAIFDSTGGVNKRYRSASPGEQAYQAKVDELRQYTPRNFSPDGQRETDAQFEARIQHLAQEERTQDREASRYPARQAADQRALDAIQEKVRAGTPLAPEERDLAIRSGSIQERAPANLPRTPADAADFLKSNPSGLVNVGGTLYKVTPGSSRGGATAMGAAAAATRFTDQATGKQFWLQDGKLIPVG